MATAGESTACILDIAGLVDRVGGDESLLREITEIFLEEYPVLMSDIRGAIDSRDAVQLERSAHSLKGSVSNFGAADVTAAAYRLETLGRRCELGEAGEALLVLESQLERLRPALEEVASA